MLKFGAKSFRQMDIRINFNLNKGNKMKNKNDIIIPTSPADRDAIKQELEAASEILTRIELEQEKIKDIASGLHETFGFPKKDVTKMISAFHKNNVEEIGEAADFLRELFTALGKE